MTYADSMTKRIKQVGWRVPTDLYRELTDYAARTRRSITGAAVYLLAQALADEEPQRKPEGCDEVAVDQGGSL